MPDVVRVEPSSKSAQPEAQTATTTNNPEEGAQEEAGLGLNNSGTAEAPHIGQHVAHKMLGSSLFRGVITEVISDLYNSSHFMALPF